MKFNCIFSVLFLFVSVGILAQEKEEAYKHEGHYDNTLFKQLKQELATPNSFRTASGQPGHAYYQQKADYLMDIEIDDKNQKLTGSSTITYTNNSPDALSYLWVQLDQNVRARDSKTPLQSTRGLPKAAPAYYVGNTEFIDFDGGFKITSLTDGSGKAVKYTINRTMLRIDLDTPLQSGASTQLKFKWWYNINDHVVNRARSGYEYFPKDGNFLYVLAQFFPRMAVYNDVEGWQNFQFWGRGEFALVFGDYKVNITVPSDHIVEATGWLQNPDEVLNKTEHKRWKKAQKSYDEQVVIVTEEEARAKESNPSDKKSTWTFHAKNVRDFGIASSRKFVWDAQAVNVGGKTVLASSVYPKEGNPLWEKYSTHAIVQTLKTYSRHTFDYPYPKAVSVHSKNQGMEYPMICWNYGRPEEDGTYSDRVKFGMISVIIHEIGHNYFPMIVNSDERQWTWMDEGLNTFLQYLAEQDFGVNYPESIETGGNDGKYPSRRGPAKNMVRYMSGNQDNISPIMTQSESIWQFGNNAYGKPATALNILRETVMGKELFDHAFKTYAQRWMFKHPTPADFFRTMEDASAVDLDYYWRGWFFTTNVVDLGVKDVKQVYITTDMPEDMKERLASRDTSDYVYKVEGNQEVNLDQLPVISEHFDKNLSANYKKMVSNKKYYYEVDFERIGGIPMPIIAEFLFDDNSKETIKLPAQIWRMGEPEITKTFRFNKKVKAVVIDPNEETADIDTSNNTWGEASVLSSFEKLRRD